MRGLLRHLRDQWPALAATLAVAMLARLLMLADPQVLRLLVDRYVMRLDALTGAEFGRGVMLLVGALVVIGLLARALRTQQEYRIAVIARRAGAGVYARSIAHSLLLPFQALERRRSGELLHVIQRARQDCEDAITGIVRLYLGALAVVVVTAYAFTVHPLLGVLHLAGLPLSGAVMLAISVPIRRRQRQITETAAGLTGSATEAIRNVELLKSLGAESQEIGRLHDANDRVLALEERKLRLVRRLTFLDGLIFHGSRAVFLATMLWLVYHRAITVGEFLSLFLYTSVLFPALSEAGMALARYQETRATFDTLDTVLDLPQEARGPRNARLGPITDVVFDGVSMRYDATQPAALCDVAVELRAGRTVAFTGPSGAGKSTLVKLLVSLYTPTAGALRVNGRDLREVDLDAYRARVGLVTQQTQLFSGTLRDNLLLSRPDATDAECRQALERATLSILGRGDALDTRIGEGGLVLSGGERQRLAIARALLRDPDLLIFDEATSSLDAVTERVLTETIRGLASARRLTVLVTHRLSAIAWADSIYVLRAGAIEECGTHAELLARGGLYRHLWNEQHAAAGVAFTR